MRDRCILELPGLFYDRDAWLAVFDDPRFDRIRISWQASIDGDGNPVYEDYLDDPIRGNIREVKFNYLPEESELRHIPEITAMLSALPPELGITGGALQLTRYISDTIFPPHTDPTRSSSIMIPLEPDDPAPIRFHNPDGTIAFSHSYRMATLVNTLEMHSVVNDGRRRSILQITVPCEFAQASMMLSDLAKS
jgi:hypothetical protein